ncbi:FRG domain-containing protein [Sphingomonas sp. OTU376]|uniref:FRG domain-containing protein n=1 Tax=Sphingomonas sp. OTU376 TaxID=3043863 RepID=UPI00313C28B4
MPIISSQVDGLDGLMTAVLGVARSIGDDALLWYRGHSLKSHKLLPGILRAGRTPQEVFDREKRLLTRFRQRSLPFWPAGYPQNDWEHLFAMQHYGVPTRLLDWSENLFISVHFALVGAGGTDEPPVIWCLDPIGWNRAAPVLSEFGNAIQVLTTTDDESDSY